MSDSDVDSHRGDDDAWPEHNPQSQEVRHSQVTAIVPDSVSNGVMATGVVVMHSVHEFTIDFLNRLTLPCRVVARVIVPHAVVESFVRAMEDNTKAFDRRLKRQHSAPGQAAQSPGERPAGSVSQSSPVPSPPRPDEFYDELKIDNDILTGRYANAVMIKHSQFEFAYDFIANIFPRSVVVARVFMSEGSARQFLASLKQSCSQFQKKQADEKPKPDGEN